MSRAFPHQALRILLAAAIVAAILAAAVRLPHVNGTTVTLFLVLAVVGIALRWGWQASLAGAIAASFGLDWYYLPPFGFGISRFDDWLSLAVFLLTALSVSHLSARANRHREEALRRQAEIEKLVRISDVLSGCGSVQAVVERVGSSSLDIPEMEGIAVLENVSGRILRTGTRGWQILDQQLRDVAGSGNHFADSRSGVAVEPVRSAAELWGSIGVAGASASLEFLRAMAEKVGMGLARIHLADKVRAAELASRSDELKSAVLDALAHEARGPLGSIRIAVTTLLSEHPGNAEQQHELLAVINEEAVRMDHWLDDAAGISRRRAADVALHESRQDVRMIVAEVLAEQRPLASSRPIDMQIAERLPMVWCDPEMISRVLRLLLDNSMKYSPPGSPVAVSAKQDEHTGRTVVTVADSGPGVPEDEKALIFEKHYRGSQHRSTIPGTGLGLASARYLVESHGGEIWVTNRPEGGAAFHFSLPAAKGVAA